MDDTKVCSACRASFPLASFNRNAKSRDGLDLVCRGCRSGRRRLHKKPDPRHTKDMFLRWRYGITIDDWDAMLEHQGGVCAICKELPRDGRDSLDVDHDHVSGYVRGLLCGPCNRAIGAFGDDSHRLIRAAYYLIAASHEAEMAKLVGLLKEALPYVLESVS